MMRIRFLLAILAITSADDSPANRRQHSKEFHLRAQERTGLLIPMYVYPENIHTNSTYNRLMDLKRRHKTVPMWVILNPASGPGEKTDANYTKASSERGSMCSFKA